MPGHVGEELALAKEDSGITFFDRIACMDTENASVLWLIDAIVL